MDPDRSWNTKSILPSSEHLIQIAVDAAHHASNGSEHQAPA